MKITLQLRFSSAVQRSPAAWLLPGESAQKWLNEISRWPVPHGELTLVKVSSSTHGSTAGVMVICPESWAAAIAACHPAGVAYGRIGRRFYLPIEAEFQPAASDEEVATLLPDDDHVYVWQPAIGLMRCDPTAQLRISDLIALPARSEKDWGRAVPGTVLNDRLLSIAPQETLVVDELLQSLRDDIGISSHFAGHLPRTPMERKTLRWIAAIASVLVFLSIVFLVVPPLWNHFQQSTATAPPPASSPSQPPPDQPTPRPPLIPTPNLPTHPPAQIPWANVLMGIIFLFFLLRLLHRSDGTASQSPAVRPAQGIEGPGIRAWFSRARQWVGQRMSAIDERLDALRNREINRLLHMLDVEPDEGLRYAMPLNSRAHRGVGARGSRLIARILDFSLGRLGGGPVDYWNVTPEHQTQLSTKYRQLASREMSLGRHRRAAYIFAELLNDLRSAAIALAAGGHYREAAALYEDQLHNPLAAAQCLERGGYLSEAIVFYERFQNHEKVAELYERLEQFDFAEQAYRRAADGKVEERNYLSAAHIWETKLHRPDEALQTLWKGWPNSTQSHLCLAETFNLMGRTASHEDAAEQVETLPDRFPALNQSLELAACFAKLARTYPDPGVRVRAADQTRVLASRHLSSSEGSEKQRLLRAVEELAPQDLLLKRDCARFASPPLRKPTPNPSPAIARPITLVKEFTLPEAKWMTVISVGDRFYAAGRRDDELLVIRGSWDGFVDGTVSQRHRFAPHHSVVMLTANASRSMWVQVLFAEEKVPVHRFPRTNRFDETQISGHPSMDERTWGMHLDPNGIMRSVRLMDDGLVLVSQHVGSDAYLSNDRLILEQLDSTTVSNEEPKTIHCPMPMIYSHGCTIIGLGKDLVGVIPKQPLKKSNWSADTTIRSLVDGPLDRILALLEKGAVLWAENPFTDSPSLIVQDLVEPVGCFLTADRIVLADDTRMWLYRLDASRPHFAFEMPGDFDHPLALFNLPERNRAALFLNNGRVLIYEIP